MINQTSDPSLATAPDQPVATHWFLIAEDFVPFRAALREMVTCHTGWRVLAEVGDGAAAVDVCRAQPPDVVLMDFLMPVMNGLQAARRIKALLPRTPIILFSSHMSETLRRAARGGAADFFIAKDELNAQTLGSLLLPLFS